MFRKAAVYQTHFNALRLSVDKKHSTQLQWNVWGQWLKSGQQCGQTVKTVLYTDRWESWCSASVTKKISLFSSLRVEETDRVKDRRERARERESEREREREKSKWCVGEQKQGRGRKSRASWPQLVWHQSNSWFLSSSHAHWTHIWFFRLLEKDRERTEGQVDQGHTSFSELNLQWANYLFKNSTSYQPYSQIICCKLALLPPKITVVLAEQQLLWKVQLFCNR